MFLNVFFTWRKPHYFEGDVLSFVFLKEDFEEKEKRVENKDFIEKEKRVEKRIEKGVDKKIM